MKLYAILVLLLCCGGVISRTVKKSTENAAAVEKPIKTVKSEPKKLKISKSKSSSTKKAPPPAIIAIEIVDPNDNSTKSKNSKRTIQSALGYGVPSANSYGVTDKPKLVFYKYSQQDIPAYQGSHQHQSEDYNHGGQNNGIQVQKAIRYDLGTTKHIEYSNPTTPQNYQPTTLFATFNQHGEVGGFTQNAPQHQHQNQQVPVIILRVYTNQLGGAVYPNLPSNHPYAGLNNINLKNMLNSFFDKHFYPQQQQQQQPQQQQYENYYQSQPQAQQYYSPEPTQQDYYLNQPNQYHQQYQDDIQQYQYNQQYDYDGLQTHENYPSNAHTRVIFHPSKTNGKDDLQRPQILPSKNANYPQPQSYSSLEFHNSQAAQDYNNYDYPQYPSQDYTIKQPQDDRGYYYYTPEAQQQQGNYQQNEDYQTQNRDYQSQQQQAYLDVEEGYPSQQQQQSQDYQSQAEESSGVKNDKGEIDTQKESIPYNYHAHPNGKSNQKRTVRRLQIRKRVNTPKEKEA